MKILAVCPFLPFPLEFGGAIRIYHLLRHLGRNHKVTLLCPGGVSREAAEALGFCAAVETVPPLKFPRPWWEHLQGLPGIAPRTVCLSSESLATRLRQLLASQQFDIIQIEFLALAHLARVLPDRQLKVLVEHCIVSELRARQLQLLPWGARRFYHAADLLKLHIYEPAAVRMFSGCVTVSRRDERRVRAWAPGLSVATIPNGVDTDHFRPQGEEDSRSLVFVGSFGIDQANVDAVLYFVRDIFPIIRRRLPDARLTIIGSAPPQRVLGLSRITGIDVLGCVDDIRPYLGRASLLVLPLRAGAGTKIRTFTAMAMQKVVLATPLATEGLDLSPGEDIVVADSAQEFAEEAVALLFDKARRVRIGSAARQRVVNFYDWRIIGGQLEAYYGALLDGGAA